MGVDDRDYMQEPEDDDDVIKLGDLFRTLLKVGVCFGAVLVSLRIPVVWIKIPLVIAILYSGWRWIFKVAEKKPPREPERPMKPAKAKVVNRREANLEQLEAEAGSPPQPTQSAIRLLIAYDAAGKFGQAKALIQHFDGKEFPEPIIEEFAVLARNYFPIELEPTKEGVRFKLA